MSVSDGQSRYSVMEAKQHHSDTIGNKDSRRNTPLLPQCHYNVVLYQRKQYEQVNLLLQVPDDDDQLIIDTYIS